MNPTGERNRTFFTHGSAKLIIERTICDSLFCLILPPSKRDIFILPAWQTINKINRLWVGMDLAQLSGEIGYCRVLDNWNAQLDVV
jgi:hypothetical protein